MSRSRLRARVDGVNREFIDLPHKFFTEPLPRLYGRRFSSLSMHHFLSGLAVPGMLAGFIVCAAPIDSGRAGEAHSFIIAANDGYGIEDCLGEGGECGRVVADAWCEAHGHGAAVAFGRADPDHVTGAIKVAGTPAKGADPYVVTCGD